MHVLVACEESGVVREAFIRHGHCARSNDLLPARDGGPHYQMDCREAIRLRRWDLIIFHPDCTKMAVSGNRSWSGNGKHAKDDGTARREQVEWTLETWDMIKENVNIGAVMENPASVLFPHVEEGVQYIQPWQFGHPEQKKTGLALYKLPRLVPTKNVYEEMMALDPKERERVFRMKPGANRKRDRSETYYGIADAFAAQYGALG